MASAGRMCDGLGSIDGWGDGDADIDGDDVQVDEVDDEARAILPRVFEPAEWYTGALTTSVSWVWVRRAGGMLIVLMWGMAGERGRVI